MILLDPNPKNQCAYTGGKLACQLAFTKDNNLPTAFQQVLVGHQIRLLQIMKDAKDAEDTARYAEVITSFALQFGKANMAKTEGELFLTEMEATIEMQRLSEKYLPTVVPGTEIGLVKTMASEIVQVLKNLADDDDDISGTGVSKKLLCSCVRVIRKLTSFNKIESSLNMQCGYHPLLSCIGVQSPSQVLYEKVTHQTDP